MLAGVSRPLQALLGTLLTWGLTAAGAAAVFCVPRSIAEPTERKILDVSLGFAAGVMLAASYWSLLMPALEISESLDYGSWVFVPAAVGFMLGGFFVWMADWFIPEQASSPEKLLAPGREGGSKLHLGGASNQHPALND